MHSEITGDLNDVGLVSFDNVANPGDSPALLEVDIDEGDKAHLKAWDTQRNRTAIKHQLLGAKC